MKNDRLLLALIFVILLLSCVKTTLSKEKTNSIVYIYYDITEGLSIETKQEYLNDIDKVLKKMDTFVDKRYIGKGSGEVRLFLLNYEYFEKPEVISIKERNELLDSRLIRRKKINDFMKSFKNKLESLLNKPISELDTRRSVIIKHIFEGIKELKESPFKTKLIIIYSDMIEHNPEADITFIRDNLDNFDNIIKKIENIYKIEIPKSSKISNISIHIIRPDHERWRSQRLQAEKLWMYIFGKCCKFQSILGFDKK